MAAQGERVSGAVEIEVMVDEPMVQATPVQDIPIPEPDIVVEELELPPQMDLEPEMGAAAAYDTSPPPLHQNPPILLEQSAIDMILQAMEANTRRMENKMKEETNGMREEMKKCGVRCGKWANVCRRT